MGVSAQPAHGLLTLDGGQWRRGHARDCPEILRKGVNSTLKLMTFAFQMMKLVSKMSNRFFGREALGRLSVSARSDPSAGV